MTDTRTQQEKLQESEENSADGNRRSEPRYASEGEAEITVLTVGNSDTLEATVEDVSKNGLRLRTARRMQIGDRLRVRFGDMLAFADVRWCKPRVFGGFSVGMSISHMVPYALVANVRRSAQSPAGDGEEETSSEDAGSAG